MEVGGSPQFVVCLHDGCLDLANREQTAGCLIIPPSPFFLVPFFPFYNVPPFSDVLVKIVSSLRRVPFLCLSKEKEPKETTPHQAGLRLLCVTHIGEPPRKLVAPLLKQPRLLLSAAPLLDGLKGDTINLPSLVVKKYSL